MKKIFTTKRLFAAAALLCTVSLNSVADSFNNVWVRADVFPANSGTVFVDWNIDEVNFGSYSEFKRSSNIGTSNAFILAEPANGWLYAGVARDMNLDGQYDAVNDKQVHVWYNFFFTAFYDHTDYIDQSSSSAAMAKAEEALAAMTNPTDRVIAVFTKGAVARRAEGQEAYGYVYSSKLYNEPGDEVTFSAYGDCDSRGSYNIYYKFNCWLNEKGDTVSTNRHLTVNVKGMEVYYAHFEATNKADYTENEKLPEQYKFDYNNTDWNGQFGAVESIEYDRQADSKMYDLQGREVTVPRKGLYIRGGKKVLYK